MSHWINNGNDDGFKLFIEDFEIFDTFETIDTEEDSFGMGKAKLVDDDSGEKLPLGLTGTDNVGALMFELPELVKLEEVKFLRKKLIPPNVFGTFGDCG